MTGQGGEAASFIAAWEEIMREHPQSLARSVVAGLRFREGDGEGALSLLQEGDRRPASARVRAAVRIAQGTRAGAVEAVLLLREVARLFPERAAAWVDLGKAAMAASDRASLDEALSHLQARGLGSLLPPPPFSLPGAREGGTTTPLPHEPSRDSSGEELFDTGTMVELLWKQGHRSEARAMLERLLVKNPTDEALRTRWESMERVP